MNLSPADQLLRQLRWRYATKKFDPTLKIPAADWAALEQALILTPSSFNLQPWKFLVVTDPATREKLLAASWNQRQVVDASHHVAFAAKKRMAEADVDAHLRRIVEVRGVTPESLAQLRKIIIEDLVTGERGAAAQEWATRQAYIALSNFMTSAALLGIDTCPMEGIEPAQYDEILGLAGTNLTTVMACAAGYRDPSDKYASSPKVRFKNEDVILRK